MNGGLRNARKRCRAFCCVCADHVHYRRSVALRAIAAKPVQISSCERSRDFPLPSESRSSAATFRGPHHALFVGLTGLTPNRDASSGRHMVSAVPGDASSKPWTEPFQCTAMAVVERPRLRRRFADRVLPVGENLGLRRRAPRGSHGSMSSPRMQRYKMPGPSSGPYANLRNGGTSRNP